MNEPYVVYIGKDVGTLPGVPARDLTHEEAKKYGIKDLISSGLYKINEEAVPEKIKNKRSVKHG